MSDTFLPAQDIAWNPGGTVGQVVYGTDARKIVKFYRRSVRNGEAAIANGEPAFIGVDHIEMYEPGERNLFRADRPATEHDKMRFARHWEAYLAGRAQVPDGTPIEALFQSDPEVVDRLKPLGFITVQQLAGAQEGAIAKIGMGARGFVTKAQEFLEATRNHDQFAAIQAQMAEMRKALAEAQEQNAALIKAANLKAPEGVR